MVVCTIELVPSVPVWLEFARSWKIVGFSQSAGSLERGLVELICLDVNCVVFREELKPDSLHEGADFLQLKNSIFVPPGSYQFCAKGQPEKRIFVHTEVSEEENLATHPPQNFASFSSRFHTRTRDHREFRKREPRSEHKRTGSFNRDRPNRHSLERQHRKKSD